MTGIEIVQIISAAVFPIIIIAIVVNRICTKKGIGVRVVQFVAAGTLLPGIVILASMGKIGGETTAALIGTFVGYLFANIANFDERK